MVLPLVISIALILAILGMGMIHLGYGSRLISILTNADISARAAADGGLTEALFRLNQALPFGGPFDESWLPFASEDSSLSYSNAHYNYDITESPTPHPSTNRRFWYINSRGRSGRGGKSVHATTSIYTAWFGIGVQRTVTIHSSPSNPVSFYPYPAGSGIGGRIRTNLGTHNAVWVGPNSDINGEILVAPNAEPTAVHVGPGSSVTSIGEAPDRLSFPDATLPVDVPLWTERTQLTLDNFVNVNDELTLDPITRATIGTAGTDQAYIYEDFDIFKVGGAETVWTEVSIQGNVILYAVNPMDIMEGCKLVVESGSTLELYLGGGLRAHNGSEIANENGPLIIPVDLPGTMALQIYGMPTCDYIVLQNSGDMWGVVYAPSADLTVDSSAAFYGSFIGGSLDMKNCAGFYYDTRLWDLQDQGPAYFAIERWWEEAGSLVESPL